MKKEQTKESLKDLEKILCSDENLSLEPLSLEELNVVNGGKWRRKYHSHRSPSSDYYIVRY